MPSCFIRRNLPILGPRSLRPGGRFLSIRVGWDRISRDAKATGTARAAGVTGVWDMAGRRGEGAEGMAAGIAERWRRCSACKGDIALGSPYWVCSVSTCNRKRTALVFCSVDCWEIHLPTERHRDAWAVEERAPKEPDPPEGAPRKRRARTAGGKGADSSAPGDEGEILVVASRLKAYIRRRDGYNTSDSVLPILSDKIRAICDEAIRNARRAERQTVLDRDVPRE